MPIGCKNLLLGCVYEARWNEKGDKENGEIALRVSINKKEADKLDESVKNQIFKEFPNIKNKEKCRDKMIEWDFNIDDFIKEDDPESIQKIMEDHIIWVNNNLKDKIQ
jgi:hypothetical protein